MKSSNTIFFLLDETFKKVKSYVDMVVSGSGGAIGGAAGGAVDGAFTAPKLVKEYNK